ncbi:MAG TPA: SpoVR family protein, partial [Parvularculaceae bacterium]|nr:SpoVR family protein [Parvularculaceae bacterium]
RDESFISQFLSPKVMRDFRLFALHDDSKEAHYEVEAIHDEMGFRKLRERLARQYDLGMHEPNIQVVSADLEGDRMIALRHEVHAARNLDPKTKEDVLWHVHRLWGHKVKMDEEAA